MKQAIPLVAASVLFAAACCPAHWVREDVEPKPFPHQQQVKIWSADSVLRWHRVLIYRDSIAGIPYKQSTTCDSCRRAIAREAVDSIRVRSPENPRDNLLVWALIVAAILVP